MKTLEDRYRYLLRMLPLWYWEKWAEDMVATYLATELSGQEDPEFVEEHGRPSFGEAVSVAALSLRLRLGGGSAPARSVAWGAAVRTVVLLGLLVNAAGTVTNWTAAPWLGAFFAVLFGQVWIGCGLAVAGFGYSIYEAVVATGQFFAGEPAFLFGGWSQVLINAGLVLGLAAFHREVPPAPQRPWLVALIAGVALELLPALGWIRLEAGVWDAVTIYALVWFCATIGHLAVPAARQLSTTLALVVVGWTIVVLRALSLADVLAFFGPNSGYLLVGAAELAIALATLLPLLVLGSREREVTADALDA
ncbi:hypothetical protein [Amycolatopsis sp. NPDC059657]|uniref:hypothetical protein n=1 Tax=Amycolatopsis sp. NPDC059657 TaxID=3346899 RepID=UPI0036719E30